MSITNKPSGVVSPVWCVCVYSFGRSVVRGPLLICSNFTWWMRETSTEMKYYFSVYFTHALSRCCWRWSYFVFVLCFYFVWQGFRLSFFLTLRSLVAIPNNKMFCTQRRHRRSRLNWLCPTKCIGIILLHFCCSPEKKKFTLCYGIEAKNFWPVQSIRVACILPYTKTI